MSLIFTLEAMVEAGCTPQMMLAVVKVYDKEREAADAQRRAKDAERQARRRALMPTPDEWQSLRFQVFERDGYVCTYCDQPAEEPHCDHIVPVIRGGSSEISNLTTACAPCNASKGARLVEDWLASR